MSAPLRMPQTEENVLVPLPPDVAVAFLAFVKEARSGSFTLHFGAGGDLQTWDERRTGKVIRDRRQAERRTAP